MRILFLNPAGQLGGAERCLLDLVASLRGHAASGRLELGLIAGGDGPFVEEAAKLGVKVSRLPMSAHLASLGDSALLGSTTGSRGHRWRFVRRLMRAGLGVPAYAAELKDAIAAFAPSVVHSNGIKMHLLAAAVGTPAPLVWHVRDFIGERPLVSRGMSLLARRATAAIAISNAVARDARGIVGKLPVTVVHDAIDTDVFTPVGPAADLDALAYGPAAPAGAVRVGFIATYARWKGHEVFLQAARLVVSMAEMAHVRFYVIGGAIYDTASSQYTEAELRSVASDLGLGDRVRFVPFLERIDQAYRALDVVVHASSRPEPFGRTIAEAMASGKPTIASLQSGASELYDGGVDAIGTPAGDPHALAEALQTLIVDRHRRERLGHAARRTAVARFSRARLADEVFGVYRDAGCAMNDR